MSKSVIITCAPTGGIHTPTMSPHLPITPQEIWTAAIDAAEAGASIIHLHARDPETGKPVYRWWFGHDDGRTFARGYDSQPGNGFPQYGVNELWHFSYAGKIFQLEARLGA